MTEEKIKIVSYEELNSLKPFNQTLSDLLSCIYHLYNNAIDLHHKITDNSLIGISPTQVIKFGDLKKIVEIMD